MTEAREEVHVWHAGGRRVEVRADGPLEVRHLRIVRKYLDLTIEATTEIEDDDVTGDW